MAGTICVLEDAAFLKTAQARVPVLLKRAQRKPQVAQALYPEWSEGQPVRFRSTTRRAQPRINRKTHIPKSALPAGGEGRIENQKTRTLERHKGAPPVRSRSLKGGLGFSSTGTLPVRFSRSKWPAQFACSKTPQPSKAHRQECLCYSSVCEESPK